MLTPGADICPKARRNKTRGKRQTMIDMLKLAGESVYDIAVTVLMTRSTLNWAWKIEPEQLICIEFADRMRKYTITGLYKGIWGHTANEGKRHQIVALIQIAMGMIPGATDYSFMGPWGHGVIEFKVRGGKLEDTQACYRDWCIGNNVPHALCHSADEGVMVLKSWGALCA